MTRLVLILTLGGLMTSAPVWGAWEIQGFSARMHVGADGRIEVTEVLNANFGAEPRAGIERAIPTLIMHPDAGPLKLGVDVRSVEDGAGTPLSYQLEKTPRHLLVRIGGTDSVLTGSHNYRIVYTVEGALVHQPTRDLLFWPAVGGEWDAPIWEVEVIVELPEPVVMGDVRAGSFTGDHAERGRAADVHTVDPARVTYRLLRGMTPYQRLTIECSWRGVGSPPPRAGPGWWTALVAGGAMLAIALLIGARRRR